MSKPLLIAVLIPGRPIPLSPPSGSSSVLMLDWADEFFSSQCRTDLRRTDLRRTDLRRTDESEREVHTGSAVESAGLGDTVLELGLSPVSHDEQVAVSEVKVA